VHDYEIRQLRERDRQGWEALWSAYNSFYRHQPPDEVTESTFSRLCAQTDGFFGLLAVDSEGQPAAIAHAVLHPSTWTTGSYCYLEDLFVANSARGSGVARALIEAVYAEADRHGADRVYWKTQAYNAPARSLYDQVAHLTSFVVYQRS